MHREGMCASSEAFHKNKSYKTRLLDQNLEPFFDSGDSFLTLFGGSPGTPRRLPGHSFF